MPESSQHTELKKSLNKHTSMIGKKSLPTLSVWLFIGLCSSIQAAEPVPVRTQTLAELAIYPESAAPAVVVSLNDAPIAAQVDALVVEVPVRVGDAVKAGAVLVQLACQDFELDRTRLQAERQATQARLELAQWQLKHTETLAAQQTLPEEQVQQKRSQLAVLRGDLAAYAARIETTRRQIAHCTVKAPFTGVATARLIAIGQFATRGTPLIRLLDISRSEVSAQVSSRETQALQKAGSLVFEHNGEHYPLRLRTVLPTIHTETGTQEVRLDFIEGKAEPDAAGRLLWHDKVMHIATEFLVKRGELLGVFTEAAGTAHFHPLPDAQNGRPAAIGLASDTRIIVSGHYNLNDNAPVTVEANNQTGGKP